MTESVVKVSMIEDNSLNCSYAIISKDKLNIIIIFKDLECAIFDLDDLKATKEYRYLLLKHYVTGSYAYTDFLKLIGKMCKKDKSSKYFMKLHQMLPGCPWERNLPRTRVPPCSTRYGRGTGAA